MRAFTRLSIREYGDYGEYGNTGNTVTLYSLEYGVEYGDTLLIPFLFARAAPLSPEYPEYGGIR